jgi:hypothetical protein
MLSNSKTQKLHIDATAAEKGFKNVTVITGDVNVYDFEEKGKYVISTLTVRVGLITDSHTSCQSRCLNI